MGTTLRLLHSNSARTLLADLLPLFEEETGVHVDTSLHGGKVLRERIAAGETADAVILGSSVLREFAEAGILRAGSVRPFARTRVAAAVRAGEPKPDIGSVDALRRTLRATRSIAHTSEGVSGQYIPVLFDKLGIAQEMQGRTVTRSSGYIGPLVVSGEADLALQQLPELLAVEGLDIVGLIPEEVQKVMETASGVFSASRHAQEAQALFAFLARPEHAATFALRGWEQLP
ncbi:MAG TPA: substrate-binding domain-containing protein [Ramlibacter sp.]|nr:substrate-binding domain-containing protein [Ramlibacter sp.]